MNPTIALLTLAAALRARLLVCTAAALDVIDDEGHVGARHQSLFFAFDIARATRLASSRMFRNGPLRRTL